MRKVLRGLAVVLVLLPSLAYGQRTTAALRGTVRDATQAVLPGVTVTVRSAEPASLVGDADFVN